MSAKNFKFVSPGVFINEIDNSQLPTISDAIGPVIIGRSRRGPAFIPTTVQSFSEFVTLFGDPVAGQEASDQWRSGVPKAPTFAAYAAQAWLRNSSPLTFIRLLGDQSNRNTGTNTSKAGWTAADSSQGGTNGGGSTSGGGGAYGLFLVNSGTAGTLGPSGTPERVTGSLAAVIYTRYGAPILSGTVRGQGEPATSAFSASMLNFSGANGSVAATNTIVFSVPSAAGGAGTTTIKFSADTDGTGGDGVDTIGIGVNSLGSATIPAGDVELMAAVRDAINGNAASNARVTAATSGNGSGTGGVQGITAFTGSLTDYGAGTAGQLATHLASIFVDASGSVGNTTTVTMAANSKVSDGVTTAVTITGGDDSRATIATGSNALVKSLDSNGNFSFKVRVINNSGVLATTDADNPVGVLEESIVNFNRSSNSYIRKVLNTDPTKTNASLVNTESDQLKSYFLGQTYERSIADKITGNSCYGFIAQLGGATNITDGGAFKYPTQAAQTGWFFSQDLRTTAASHTAASNKLVPAYNPEVGSGVVDRLFKFHTLSTGEEEQRNYKISIEDIKYSKNDNTPYGSFTIAIRDIKDNDGARIYVERYTNCNLDPSSPNYIAKKIGDRYYKWSENDRRVIEYGTYPNISNIVRVDMAPAVDSSQLNPEVLPFGVEGPLKLTDFNIVGSSGVFSDTILSGINSPVIIGSGSTYPQNFGSVTGSATQLLISDHPAIVQPLSASIEFPRVPLRLSSSTPELANKRDAYFGATFTRSSASVIYEDSMQDVLYPLPAGGQAFSAVSNETELSWYFSLDDLVYVGAASTTTGDMFYQSGSRELGSSTTAMTGSYKSVLDKGYDRFTTPLFGGFNGFDITENEPLNASRALVAGATETQYSMAYTIRKGIDMFSDPEYIEGNLLAVPGVTNEGLTTHMINTCEERGDALAVIDPLGGYTPAAENYETEEVRISATHVSDVVNSMTSRNLNSSYGAAYYPWVRISDTISGQGIWAPPSVAAIGAMSFNDNQAAPWFAPAGFNRGGLSAGAAGIPVTNVRSKLSSQERDELYDANINPIASFPNEGIVIFGQKTLQVTPSALDRINVRRLMIFVKKEISRIAADLLFEPNVAQTWSRFTGRVNPLLNGIKNDFGLDAFRVVLDETTTTPDLVDRNVIYAKIFLKPTKAVEFFAIDFVITNSGAGFED
jgi:phage tail sheath protein FI